MAGEQGKRVLVCEMDDKGSLAAYLGCPPLKFEPTEVSSNVSAMAMNTEDSLREYIRLFLRLPIIGSLTPLARIFDFVANAAPAVKEILAVGKLCYEVREQNYDMVIVDSEASGHFVAQVSAPDALATLVRIGIIADQTKWMSNLLHDPQVSTVLAVVTEAGAPRVTLLNEEHADAQLYASLAGAFPGQGAKDREVRVRLDREMDLGGQVRLLQRTAEGVEAAAQHFFGVSAADLSAVQAARPVRASPWRASRDRPGPRRAA